MSNQALKLSACHGGPAQGIHIGKVEDGPFGGTIPVTLCGVGRNPLFDIYWRRTAATQVTCRACYEKAKELHEKVEQ